MAQDHNRSLFNSFFGSKRKTEEKMDVEKESRQKLEDRIREVLVIVDAPKPWECEPAPQKVSAAVQQFS